MADDDDVPPGFKAPGGAGGAATAVLDPKKEEADKGKDDAADELAKGVAAVKVGARGGGWGWRRRCAAPDAKRKPRSLPIGRRPGHGKRKLLLPTLVHAAPAAPRWTTPTTRPTRPT
jgi:hypothetical protein